MYICVHTKIKMFFFFIITFEQYYILRQIKYLTWFKTSGAIQNDLETRKSPLGKRTVKLKPKLSAPIEKIVNTIF